MRKPSFRQRRREYHDIRLRVDENEDEPNDAEAKKKSRGQADSKTPQVSRPANLRSAVGIILFGRLWILLHLCNYRDRRAHPSVGSYAASESASLYTIIHPAGPDLHILVARCHHISHLNPKEASFTTIWATPPYS
ncbi:hypothetical protein M422DRAFT_264253 [Sphaerobolus stellatus SS14]|uniref:Uncharacterized protein n=1 Tax=Sphaerobolus stellatus (strain SS14) TaxID=990650 RepID=A0A0C9V8M0_SPHS4|nr:hypothetical protein M422DRAFT_264253 [Sphaerobolus stellatus SS14]